MINISLSAQEEMQRCEMRSLTNLAESKDEIDPLCFEVVLKVYHLTLRTYLMRRIWS